ncbi:MAG: hypothetical protein RL148_1557 [Planctomycetota bacterium]
MRMRNLPAACLALALLSCADRSQDQPQSLSVFEALSGGDPAGHSRALERPELSFPRDHGAHPDFRTEWWYWTGNLKDGDGCEYGFQLVFFQQAVAPAGTQRRAAMASRHLVLAHAALTDVAAGVFHHRERVARAAAGVAGVVGPATSTPFRVHCEDWSAASFAADELLPMRLQVAEQDFAFDLRLDEGKPVVLQGDGGLSQKSAEPGNASIYYSVPRIRVQGSVRSGSRSVAVTGSAWLDREWSTSSLGEGQVGWDWFSLQLEGGEELMWYQLRRSDGSVDPWSRGCHVRTDGSSVALEPTQVRVTPGRRWTAPDGVTGYPVDWRLEVPHLGLDLSVQAKLPHQELRTVVRYWEGCVRVQGTRGDQRVQGEGYLEMTGYEGAPRR